MYMNSKYLFLLTFAAGLVVLGCNKSDVPEQNNDITIKASIAEEAEDATKVDLNISTLDVSWADDEVIKMFFPGISLSKFYSFEIDDLSISGDGKSASFTNTDSMSSIPSDDYLGGAVAGGYGEKEAISKPGWYLSGKIVGLRYPYYQFYQAGGPKSEYLYLATNVIDRTKLSNLVFRHKSSIIHIPVIQADDEDPVTLKSIEIVCDNEPISGRFYGGLNANTGSAPNYALTALGTRIPNQAVSANAKGKTSIRSGGEYGDSVILKDESDGTIGNPLSKDSAQHFYLVVAPGSHGHFTINLTAGAVTKTWSTVAKDVVISTTAGKVYHFPTLDWSSK